MPCDPLAKHLHTSNVLLCSQLLRCSHIENWLWSARPEKGSEVDMCFLREHTHTEREREAGLLQGVCHHLSQAFIDLWHYLCAPLDICRAWSSVNGTKLNLTAFGHTRARRHCCDTKTLPHKIKVIVTKQQSVKQLQPV